MEKFFRSAIRRYYEVELPRNPGEHDRSPLLIALHGYEGNKDSMMRVAAQVADGQMVVVSLQGPYQFFDRLLSNPNERRVCFGWGTTYKVGDSIRLHQRDVETVIQRSVSRHNADPKRVFLLGFSQACSFNYRYVFSHPDALRGVIAVCGGVPGDWDENPQYQQAATHVLHIAARQDEWYSREKNLEFRRQLRQRAGTLDFRFYDSPHKFPRSAIPHIRQWIEEYV